MFFLVNLLYIYKKNLNSTTHTVFIKIQLHNTFFFILTPKYIMVIDLEQSLTSQVWIAYWFFDTNAAHFSESVTIFVYRGRGLGLSILFFSYNAPTIISIIRRIILLDFFKIPRRIYPLYDYI